MNLNQNNDRFYIGAYWSPRPESLIEAVTKTSLFLNKIALIGDEYSRWYELGYSLKDAKTKIIQSDYEMLEKLYKKRLNKDEVDSHGYSKIGYSLSAWSGNHENSLSLSITVGSNNKFVLNCCVIKLPIGYLVDHSNINKVVRIMKMLYEIWNPEYVVLNSTDLRETLKLGNKIGWISLYPKKLLPKIDSRFNIDNVENKAILFGVTEPFDLNAQLTDIEDLKSKLLAFIKTIV